MRVDDFFEHLRKGKVVQLKPTYTERSSTRSHRLAVVRGAKQAVFKILSKGSGKRSLRQVTSYISDDCEKEIVTEYGSVSNHEELEILRTDWLKDFDHPGKRKRSIDFVHLALSVPAGESREATERAAMFMMNEYFTGRRWMAVRHDNTANPHVHIVIQNRDADNRPLPLRKSDLLDYREQWVTACRAQGINVEAILRTERGQIHKQQKTAMVKLRERGEPLLFEEARRIDAHKTPESIQNFRIDSLLRVAKEYAQEASASTKAQAVEKKELANHVSHLVNQAKSLASNKRSVSRIKKDSQQILRLAGVTNLAQKQKKGLGWGRD